MSSNSKLYFGIAIHCLSIIAILVYFIAKNAQTRKAAGLEKDVAALTERVDSLTTLANETEGTAIDGEHSAEAVAVTGELARIRLELSRPEYLSHIAFATWAVLSIGGSSILMLSTRSRREPDKINT